MRHVDTSGDCWLWTAQIGGTRGRYGYFRMGTKTSDPRITAHRVSHLLFIGPIPEGYEVDHSCRNTLCVNPAHLEAVTPDENKRRARLTMCRAGLHDLSDPENIRWDNQGRRRGCLRCWLDRAKERYHAQKEN